jgi:hypothetical protein
MKELERSGTFPEPWLRLMNNAPKVRQGLIGGYRDALSEDDIAYLNGVFGDWYRDPSPASEQKSTILSLRAT